MNTIQTDLFFAKLKLASKSDPVYSAKLEIDLKLSGVQAFLLQTLSKGTL